MSTQSYEKLAYNSVTLHIQWTAANTTVLASLCAAVLLRANCLTCCLRSTLVRTRTDVLAIV